MTKETSSTNSPVIDCQELCSLVTSAMDYSYQFGLSSLLNLDNPVEADPYFEQTVSALFDGRDLCFTDIETGQNFKLNKESLMRAAYEYAMVYPDKYAEVGGADGYIPQIGMKILLGALYGWPEVATTIGERFERYLKAA